MKTSSKEEKCWRNPDRETTLKQREIRNFGGTSRSGSESVTGRFWIGFVFLMGYMVQRGSVLSFFDEISTLDTRDHPETPPDWIGKSATMTKIENIRNSNKRIITGSQNGFANIWWWSLIAWRVCRFSGFLLQSRSHQDPALKMDRKNSYNI